MSEKKKILVIGSVNIDFVVRTQTLPRAGETLAGGTFSTVPGGKGANQAVAAQRLGAQVSMNACVGNDAYAEIALSNLKNDGVDLAGVRYLDNETTGAAFINVSDDGENQIAVASGANLAFTTDQVWSAEADAIISQLEVPPAVIWDGTENTDCFFCLNTAPVQQLEPQLIQRANLLVMNETEADFYADSLGGFDGLVAKTYGGAGAALFSAGKKIAEAKPPKVNAVDTTGAGDCFTAALTVALIEGQDPQAALRFACAAGALATTQLGAQSALPYRPDVLALA